MKQNCDYTPRVKSATSVNHIRKMGRRNSVDRGRVSKPDSTARPYAYKKTERSHEENQERAYIAASRRSDRSLEARLQSARQASEIHKQRTGKYLRITEEVVRNEEMYEEEEDEFPRSMRLLQTHMQTNSPALNERVESFLSSKVAMHEYLSQNQQHWQHENAINRAFAEAFPAVNAQQQRSYSTASIPQSPQHMSMPIPPQSPYHAPVAAPRQQHGSMPGSFSPGPLSTHNGSTQYSSSSHPHFGQVSYQQPSGHHSRGPSFSGVSPAEQQPDLSSPPALTPGSQGQTPQSQATPYFANTYIQPNSSMDYGFSESAFTTELPNDAKLLFDSTMQYFDPAMDSTGWTDAGYPELTKMGDEQVNQTDYPDLTPQPSAADLEPDWGNFINIGNCATEGVNNTEDDSQAENTSQIQSHSLTQQ